MKITLDIPNDTICGFFNFVRGDWCGLSMQTHSISSDQMKDGATIEIVVLNEGE